MNAQAELAKPNIPMAADDGLITVKDLEAGISVHIPVSADTNHNDSYELLIDGAPTGITYTLPAQLASGQKIALIIQSEYFPQDGYYAIGYRWTTHPGGFRADSNPAMVRIDRTAPGSALMAPIMFSQINFGDELHGRLPGYAGMERGDLIQTLVNGKEGPVYAVKHSDHTAPPLQISLPRSLLDGILSEVMRISYYVTDRAGNRSVESQAASLSYQSGQAPK
jgi:hypothetical protein